MTSCIGTALIIHCVLDPTPRPSPAEAAAILAPPQFVGPPPAEGPCVVIIGSSPTAGPFGELFSARAAMGPCFQACPGR